MTTLSNYVAKIGRSNPHLKKLIMPLSNLCRKQKKSAMAISGFDYSLNTSDLIQSQMFYLGMFDKKGVDLICNICKKIQCRVALDIGGNVGNHAIHLSDVCEQVISFEPNESSGNVFKGALSSKESNITLHNFGLSNKSEMLEFFEDSNNLGRSSFVREHIEKNKFHAKKTLEVKHGDDFITTNKISEIDFIKIDVEGFEFQVITGLKNTIIQNQPIIDFEFNTVTRNAFKSLHTLKESLPKYSFIGTHRKGFGILTEKLIMTDFNFESDYAHVIAIPERFNTEFDI